MINHELKDLFKQNSVHKKFVIDYDGGTITNSDMFMEEFSLEESLSSEEELRFGSCEASVVRFPVSNVFTSLNGNVLDVSVVLDHNEDKPIKIGKYKVASDIPTADRKRKDITAYDALYDVINANVADWYNALLPNNDSTVTLKQFRDSFFGYFSIEQVEVSLVNDDMIVTKTIQPTELSGSVVANAICELNGCFGHINRDGLMDYVFLEKSWSALYPSNDLYPSEDLYPRDDKSHKYSASDYQIGDCDYEDYVSQKITGLEIRQAENSIGAFIGTKENPYVVSDNFLTYGKSTEEITEIANNMFGMIKDIEYRPFTLNTFRGNPCAEVGDGITIYTDNQIIESYILNRTITGIQALSDSFETRGREYRAAQVNSVEKSIIQLRGKTNTLERNIDETRSEIADVERGLSSQITQTADAIRSEVSSEITETKEYADNSAQNALENAENSTDEKLKSYSTTTQMNSAISQSAQGIRTEVSQEITTTKTYADTVANSALQSANSNTDNKLKSYSTTTQMNSAIDQTATSIRSEVSKTYATKDETEELSSEIEQTAESISTKVSKGEVISEINQSAEQIKIQASKIALEGTVTANGNVTIGTDGKLTAKNGSFEGTVNASTLYAKDKILMTAPSVGIPTAQQAVGYESGTDNKFPVQSTYRLALDDIVRIGNVLIDGIFKTYYGNVVGKVECSDNTQRYAIGTLDTSANRRIAYIASNEKDEDKNAWFITVNGNWGASEWASHNIYSGSSDIRLKENIENTKINNAIEIIEKIKVREFDWKNNGGHQKIGFVADELEEIDKSLAFGGGYEENGTPNYKTVNGFYLQGYEIKAIQELSAENKELKAEIDELKKSVSFLMEKLGGMANE